MSGSAMGRAGAAIMGGSNATLSVKSPQNSLLPNSFKTALEEIEDEILELQKEVCFQKKEMMILHSEQCTIVDVAKAQDADIERYLNKENKILDDVICKQQDRQCTEFKRLNTQCCDVRNMLEDLDSSRMECVRKLCRVQDVLGVRTDPNEAFMQPLSIKA